MSTSLFTNQMSHPAWVCGLKQKDLSHITLNQITSHPAWVCGLKQISWIVIIIIISHTLRGCVD